VAPGHESVRRSAPSPERPPRHHPYGPGATCSPHLLRAIIGVMRRHSPPRSAQLFSSSDPGCPTIPTGPRRGSVQQRCCGGSAPQKRFFVSLPWTICASLPRIEIMYAEDPVFSPLLLFLSACASSSGVFRVDDNTYRVSTRATWELGGRAGAMRMALEEATHHCEAQRKVLRVIKSTEDYGHFEGGTVDLLFSCEQSKQ